jgi:hypothetical protein
MGIKVPFEFSIATLHSNEFLAAVWHFLRFPSEYIYLPERLKCRLEIFHASTEQKFSFNLSATFDHNNIICRYLWHAICDTSTRKYATRTAYFDTLDSLVCLRKKHFETFSFNVHTLRQSSEAFGQNELNEKLVTL